MIRTSTTRQSKATPEVLYGSEILGFVWFLDLGKITAAGSHPRNFKIRIVWDADLLPMNPCDVVPEVGGSMPLAKKIAMAAKDLILFQIFTYLIS